MSNLIKTCTLHRSAQVLEGQDPKEIAELEEELAKYDDLFHVSGFSHPELLVYANTSPYDPIPTTWGLIPQWVKSEKDKLKFWNSTLNCRSESMFEKPSFRNPAQNKRCLVYVNGFYEYHHFKGKKYPFYVHMKDDSPICLGGLWDEWLNKETGELEKSFTIVTTVGNKMLSKIHNNPKLDGPRMPVILSDEKADDWLNTSLTKEEVEQLIMSFPDDEMEAYTVGKLQGKDYVRNVEKILQNINYKDLEL